MTYFVFLEVWALEKFYEKHTKDLYKGEFVPFIAKKVTLSKLSIPWVHWHENLEFIRCYSGVGDAILSGNRFAVDEGDVICINSESPHAFSAPGQTLLRYGYVIIDSDFLRQNGVDPQALRLSSHIHDAKAADLFDKAIDACMAEGDFSVLKSRTAMLEFICYITEHHLSDSDAEETSSSIDEIKKAVNYIRNNYNKDITLQSAASVAGFSVCYFSRKFKKITGQTFITFLNTVRCENAANMLKGGAKVSDVCYECGFNEPSYFSRIFKSVMGCSPSDAGKF